MMEFDFIIIGSGIAGLNFALNAAEKGRVLVITKKQVAESSTNYAQGGISAVLDKADSFDQHVKDTMEAGGNHNDRDAVEFMVKKAPEAIRRLIEFGVEFDEDEGHIDLRLEGGHSSNRIVHVGDYTGQAIEEALVRRVKNHQKIEVWEDAFAVDVLVDDGVCVGVKIIRNEIVEKIFAAQTIIATGGLGQIYKYTSNPDISTGDGLAMAARAGCEFMDMEFIQFHPTAFAWDGEAKFLLSEALRGEGAFLCHEDKVPFMKNHVERGDLAPRDLVARAVFEEARRGKVYLKFPEDQADLATVKFPHISRMLAKYELDLGNDLIPVMPAAHFICGGIKTDLKGRTNVKNLFAFGEVAGTGVHGANRLASNSLLEALVFSGEILEVLGGRPGLSRSWQRAWAAGAGPGLSRAMEKNAGERVAECGDLSEVKEKIQQIMWENVGIVRNMDDMRGALVDLSKIKSDLEGKSKDGISEDLIVALNMVTAGMLVTEAALKRPRSLGGHFVV